MSSTARAEAESARYARRRLRERLTPLPAPRGPVAALALIAVLVGALQVANELRRPAAAPAITDGSMVVTPDGRIFVVDAGVAYPTVNAASGLLASDRVVHAQSTALDGLPRGRPRGITGAPLDLPGSSSVAGAAWQLCTDGPGAITLAFGAPPFLPPPDREQIVVHDGVRPWLVQGGARSPLVGDGAAAVATIPELIALLPARDAASPAGALVAGGSVVCAQSDPAAPFARPSAGAVQRATDARSRVAVPGPRGVVSIVLAPGSGVLAHRGSGGYWLLTSSAELAGIADDAALRRLGYLPQAAVWLPAALFALLVPGAELSVAAARLPAA